MAESLRDLVVSLSLNTDNFTRNIKSVGKQIQEAESEFKLAAAGIKDFENTPEGLSKKLETLERKLSLQKDAVAQYERALTSANDKLTECYDRQTEYEHRLQEAKERQVELREEVTRATETYEQLRNALGESDSATIAAQQNMESARQEYEEATRNVEQLSGQCDALQRSTQNAADAVSTAQTQLNRAQAGVRETEAAIRETTTQLRTAQSAWTSMGKALTDFSKKCETVGKNAVDTGKKLTGALTTPIAALGTASIKASIDFESSFASVRKTVDATEEEFNRLTAISKRMSTEIAASTDTINEVMATGGQLGVETEHLEKFTKVMIDLSNSCEDLNADEAATSIAKFANVMGTSQDNFDRIGSTIVHLGNNFATTEKPIMEMAQRLAGAGRQVGLTESQILGFSAALSSVGIEAQMGGSAFSKALIKMEVACTEGGETLKQFGAVSGMTAVQFKTLFENDPAAAFQAFITGLAQLDEEGESTIAVLNEIGIKEVRLRDTLLRSVNATELFAKAQGYANDAWEENEALAAEAGKRYATTASRLMNLKNKAALFTQQLGDDLSPTVQKLLDGADGLVQKLVDMDEPQRTQLIKWATIAAGIGPVILGYGKITKGIGAVTGALGKFAASVGAAGGGFGGFMSVIGNSPVTWIALAAAIGVGTVALIDYASGAKAAREALEGMNETAKHWKDTAADTFYGNSEGLTFFGMSESDFRESRASAQDWKDGLVAVWTDGKRKSKKEISEWTASFKELTQATRSELAELKAAADESGYSGVSDQLTKDMKTLDSMDKEIEKLLKKRKKGSLTDEDKIRLQELVDTREAIEIRYHLANADAGGFDTIADKVEAEIARARAKGKQDADASVYENALVAAAEGMSAVNDELDAEYDKEYALLQLIEDSEERAAAQAELDAKYRDQQIALTREYAETMASIVMPVWNQDDIQKAGTDVRNLIDLMTNYSTASAEEQTALLEQMNALTAGMDEGSLTEYVSLLTQIQSLMDGGMSEEEINAMFPDIDFTNALDQIAAIQAFLTERPDELPGLASMFGEALPEEVLKISTDLDMTGAQARWDAFAADPGQITTAAVIAGYSEAEGVKAIQPMVDAFVSRYTEVPEGADRSALTAEGLIAYVAMYAERTGGADISGLSPDNVTAMVTAYSELAEGADISTLKPDEVTAYVMEYLEKNGVDTKGLSPDGITAFVMAYEEVNGGALTSSLMPTDIAALVTKYLEDEDIDISKLSEPQLDAIITSFSEATNCDKSAVKAEVVAMITAYEEAKGVVKPSYITTRISITGYDLTAYRQFVRENPIEVMGTVRLSEIYADPKLALDDPNVMFWKNGVSVPANLVVAEQLRPDTVAVLNEDGTMHILITPEVSGTKEALDAVEAALGGTEHQGSIGAKLFGDTTFDDIERLNEYLTRIKGDLDSWFNFGGWMDDYEKNAASKTLSNYLDMEEIGMIQTYVAESIAAINSGEELNEETISNLQSILDLVNLLDAIGVGENVSAGIAEGMTDAGWETDAETVASNLQMAIEKALQINSPSKRMNPVGEYVSAGIGEGIGEYDFSPAAGMVATLISNALSLAIKGKTFVLLGKETAGNIADGMVDYSFENAAGQVGSYVKNAASAHLSASFMKPIGQNAMSGLAAGIRAGKAGVISAMREAAKSAVKAAKDEMKIQSPSRVFRDEVGVMAMRGLGEGILKETEAQVKAVRKASRYLIDEARESTVYTANTDNRRTYNQQSTVNLNVSSMNVHDQQDIRSLAIEIAALTRRNQVGRGLA